MDRQSAPPGPEIGWAFGGLGFVVTIVVGSLVDAGVGFVLLSLVLWGALGALFAFLVERSTIEEHDRVAELQNTRLATLQPVRERPARATGARAARDRVESDPRDARPLREQQVAVDEAPDGRAVGGPGPEAEPEVTEEAGTAAPGLAPEQPERHRTGRPVTGYRRVATEDAERDPAAA